MSDGKGEGLGPIADRLEEIGHWGPAAGVRTLEFLLGLKFSHDLDDVLDHALIRLRDDDRPEMAAALRAALLCLEERRVMGEAIRDLIDRWNAGEAGVLGLAEWLGMTATEYDVYARYGRLPEGYRLPVRS